MPEVQATPEPVAVEEETEKPAENGDATEKTEKVAEEPPKEMRAIVLTGFGGLKTVKLLKKPEPTAAEGEVIIRVKACGLNFQDLMVRLGMVDAPPKTPFILGMECAGDIEAVGEGVEGLKVGDRVAALPEYRGWAELVAVPSKYVYKLPDAMSYQDAAAITLNYVVAHILLFELGGLEPGKKLLLHSAGGGVGQAAAQLARTVSDVKILGVASKGKHEIIKDSVDVLLERGTDFAPELRKVAPEGVDLVLDCHCGEESTRGLTLLAPLGRYIVFGAANLVTGETRSIFSTARSWLQVDKVSRFKLFEENKSLLGLNFRHLLYQQGGAETVRKTVEKVWALWGEGKIKPIVDSTWAWEDIAEAMQKLHDRKNVGKLVLDPAQAAKPKPATPLKGKKANSVDKEEKKKEEPAAAAAAVVATETNGTNGTTEKEETPEPVAEAAS